MIIDLRKGLGDFEEYSAWKFPAGEIHFKLKSKPTNSATVTTNMSCSDDIILLAIVSDSIRKCSIHEVNLRIDYMAYQQADRNFGELECFSLKTICNLINSLHFNNVIVFDPHSDVTPALLNNCTVIDNSEFIKSVISNFDQSNLIVLAPDAGAYKKIFSLCEKVGFNGQVECCSKSRNHETGAKTIVVPKFYSEKHVLIIDDICLAGGTFLGIKSQMSNQSSLAISHGIFNNGVAHLLEKFDCIYTTDSRCEIINEKIKIYKL